MSGPYTVLLLDDEGCHVSNTEEGSLRLARQAIRDKLREPNHKGGYAYQDAVRAQILDSQGVIIHDQPVRFPHPDPRVRQAEGDATGVDNQPS